MTELRDPGPIEFDAPLKSSPSSGAACFVDFDHDLGALYGKGNLVPVRVVWDEDVEYRGSIAKMGGDCAMVLCRKDVLARLGKRAGDTVHVRIELDTAPRPVMIPQALAATLAADSVASAGWARLSPSSQRDYADWIAGAKQPATLQRRLEKALPLITAGQRLK